MPGDHVWGTSCLCDDDGSARGTGRQDGTRTHPGYDGADRLTVAALPDGARHTMTYDATGLRRRRETAAGTTLFVWDARDVLVETDAQGTTQAAYTQTPALYGELVSQRRGGRTGGRRGGLRGGRHGARSQRAFAVWGANRAGPRRA